LHRCQHAGATANPARLRALNREHGADIDIVCSHNSAERAARRG